MSRRIRRRTVWIGVEKLHDADLLSEIYRQVASRVMGIDPVDEFVLLFRSDTRRWIGDLARLSEAAMLTE